MGEGNYERVPCPNLFSNSTPTGTSCLYIGPPFYQTWCFCWHCCCIIVSKIIPFRYKLTGCQCKYSAHGELLWAQLLLHLFAQILFSCGKILIFKSHRQDVFFQLFSHRWFFLDIYHFLREKTELWLIVFLFFLTHNAHNNVDQCAVKTDSSLVFQKTWWIAIV